jgi:hypothetical protein
LTVRERVYYTYCDYQGKAKHPCDFRQEPFESLGEAREALEIHEKEMHKGKQVGTFGFRIIKREEKMMQKEDAICMLIVGVVLVTWSCWLGRLASA